MSPTSTHSMEGAGAQQLLLTVAENLELENQALLRRDGSILTAVDHGDRLIDLQGRLAAATASGSTTIRTYAFDDVSMSLLLPFGKQTGLSIGIHAHRHGDRGDLRLGGHAPVDDDRAVRPGLRDAPRHR